MKNKDFHFRGLNSKRSYQRIFCSEKNFGIRDVDLNPGSTNVASATIMRVPGKENWY